ncbi:P-loop containing nucleoside triphosphate hydrolase protein [Apodospora peruviana]|uniref:P-loop containing nucleoside triphosphate hydrolase protein n=1 Tax=Apodospora peruviana TaxID=516989 RepID=A0AAE0MB21_9PEZI|nr:P-loop containing nucleoside triphosphate hydrolase protein [Apodospora peruviana]
MSEMERSRNLIFVAHSFGGLVVKRALVQAQASRDFGHIAEHTKSILFLGTPHRGTSFGSWGWLAAQALQPLGSNPLLLANLEYDSISLHDFHKEFMAIAQDDLRVFNFFEKRPTQLLRLWFIQWQQFCVREQSATYEGQNVRNIGLSVNHYGLNKFRSRQDVSYKTILAKLVEVTTSPTRSDKRHYAVPLETVHTYTERAELSAELEQKLQTRHEKASIPYAVALHGLGGAGKSQLALAYAEKHKDRYNPILWIDATDEEAVRSSYKRCAAELALPEERAEKQGSVLTDGVVQTVLRWLRDRTEAHSEWLVIVDNADDVSWGIQKIMPKGNRGSVIVTSRDNKSVRLVPGTCELVHVNVMSPVEGVALLLKHLQLKTELASEEIRSNCDKIAQQLGYLALAIDLAGAYIANDSTPKHALSQYLTDYDRHRDELLQMDGFQGLLPTEKTPELLLTFLAQFKGSIVQNESFRLACLGMEEVDAELDGEADKVMPACLRQFLPLDKGEWDSFRYRQSCGVLVHYSLLQRVEGQWSGVTMHSLVQWRAMQSERDQPWRWWYTTFILAACCRMIGGEEQPEFRRHLIVHLPDISENDAEDGDWRRHEGFRGSTFGRMYYGESRWSEAEKLFVQVMETRKTKLGGDHPSTLTSMADLASTFWNQDR